RTPSNWASRHLPSCPSIERKFTRSFSAISRLASRKPPVLPRAAPPIQDRSATNVLPSKSASPRLLPSVPVSTVPLFLVGFLELRATSPVRLKRCSSAPPFRAVNVSRYKKPPMAPAHRGVPSTTYEWPYSQPLSPGARTL